MNLQPRIDGNQRRANSRSLNSSNDLPLVGVITGQTAPSEFWKEVRIPTIKVEAKRPVFHESGYASGHAAEPISVPGLTDTFQRLQAPDGTQQSAWTNYRECQGGFRACHGWAKIEWTDCISSVFLAHVYDGRKDVFHMSN